MRNIPEIKLGMAAVSRDCFPVNLSASRRDKIAEAFAKKNTGLFTAQTVVENENDVHKVLEELRAVGVNALVVYLGNFGPEGPETLLAQKFGGPVMFAGASEEAGNNLINGRGDAYCGMLNASYNLGLRGVKAYIPNDPVGTADEVADMIEEFVPVARIQLGIKKLKIISFGPRPFDFLACNGPIKPLYDLGIEVQENSELDLFASFNSHANDKRITPLVEEMKKELGSGNKHPGILPKLAQYELTLLDWAEANKGASDFVTIAGKCWPAFQTQFGFVPCYINSRLAAQNIPVACETDIYGALSEYILLLATLTTPTLLDINNTVPKDMYESNKANLSGYKQNDLFMGFHCGNTSLCNLIGASMEHQLIMHRLLEPDSEPNISRGTLEGRLKPGAVTLFRLQATAGCELKSYIAHGEVKDIEPKSFGGIGIIAVPELARFFRHVLIEKCYPHHSAVSFTHTGKALYSAMKLLGVGDIDYNRPPGLPYPGENPF